MQRAENSEQECKQRETIDHILKSQMPLNLEKMRGMKVRSGVCPAGVSSLSLNDVNFSGQTKSFSGPLPSTILFLSKCNPEALSCQEMLNLQIRMCKYHCTMSISTVELR